MHGQHNITKKKKECESIWYKATVKVFCEGKFMAEFRPSVPLWPQRSAKFKHATGMFGDDFRYCFTGNIFADINYEGY
jgi:hypothetical protein